MALVLLLAACARHEYAPQPLTAAARPAEIAAARLDTPATIALLRAVGESRPDASPLWSPRQLGLVAVGRAAAVSAARADVALARAAADVAAQPPPVGLEVGVSQADALDPGESSRWTAGPSLSLRFSPAGKRRLRAEVAGAEVLAAEAAVLARAWDARRRALDAALSLARARRERADTLARTALLEEAAAIAREQVESGLAGASEWQLLRLEANGALMTRAETVTRIAAAGGELAAALAMPLSALDGIRIDVATIPPAPPPREDWQRAALTRHPDILVALAHYEQRERALELAVAEQYPDIELTPGYLFDQGDNVWSLLGGMVLPLPARQHAAIAQAIAARDAAGAAFERVQSDRIGRVEQAFAALRARLAALSEFGAARDAAGAMLREVEALPLLEAGDALLVPRARLQLARAEARLAIAVIEAQQAQVDLQFAAAWAVDDAAFARQLESLAAGREIAAADE